MYNRCISAIYEFIKKWYIFNSKLLNTNYKLIWLKSIKTIMLVK